MQILKIRHSWPEKKGFYLERKNGNKEYVLIHFQTPAKTLISNKMCSVDAGGFVIYNINTPQIISSPDFNLIHDWAHITGDLPASMHKYGIEFDKIYNLTDSGFVTAIMMRAENEFLQKNLYSDDISDALLRQLLALAARNIKSGLPVSRPDDMHKTTLNEIRLFAFSNLEEPINIGRLAAMAAMSESHFYSAYKAFFGISPAKDIITARIERAKTLLSSKKYTVKQVAALCGYREECHFIRQFHKMTGTTPKNFTL